MGKVFAAPLPLRNDHREQSVKFLIVEPFDGGVEIAWQDMLWWQGRGGGLLFERGRSQLGVALASQ